MFVYFIGSRFRCQSFVFSHIRFLFSSCLPLFQRLDKIDSGRQRRRVERRYLVGCEGEAQKENKSAGKRRGPRRGKRAVSQVE